MEQRAKRRAAMTDGQLTFRGRFAERAAERRIVEQRIVAETMRPARLLQDRTFHCAAKSLAQTPAIRERNHANESCGAVTHATEALQQQLIVGFVGGAGP